MDRKYRDSRERNAIHTEAPPAVKILLISPRGSFLSRDREFQEFFSRSRELATYRRYWSGLGQGLPIVAGVTPPDIQVELVDENHEAIDFSAACDLVGLTAMTQQADRAYEIAAEFRARGTRVVMGGIHATVLPEEARRHVDSVVVGEAERLWPRLLEDVRRGKLAPVYSGGPPVDLRDTPLPRYDLLRGKRYQAVWLQTTRGCPRDCEFCAASRVFGTAYRHKDEDQVLEEVALVRRTLEGAQIGFGDDNMFVNQAASRKLLEKLIPLKIRWYTQTDISVARDDGFLKLLRRSGCMVLFIGFETLTEEGLRGIDARGWKLRQLARYAEDVRRIQGHGIGVMGAFMVGLDSDEISCFERIHRFVTDNNLYAAQITISTPLPGTRLRERLEREGRLLPARWREHTCLNVTFRPRHLSPDELRRGLLDLYRSIYSKENHARKVRHFTDIYKHASRGAGTGP